MEAIARWSAWRLQNPILKMSKGQKRTDVKTSASLVVTGASLVVTGALLVVTMFASRNNLTLN